MKQEIIDWLNSEGVQAKDCEGYIEVNGLHIYLLLLDNEGASISCPNDTNSLMITSYEVVNKSDQVKSILLAKLNRNKRLQGRECTVKEIDKITSRNFLDEYHIQGHNNLTIVSFGLYCEDELVGIITLGRHSRQTADNRIVLDRLCFKAGINVIGGSSKLFSRCIDWANKLNYDEIISFSDNRWGVGNVYNTLGFQLEKEYRPDYFYYDRQNKRCFSKQSQKKSSCNCPDSMTEFEWASYRGLVRFYDWGKKRWAYNLKPNERMSWTEARSHQCATQHKDGVFQHSHIRGYFQSEKNQAAVYYGSSYELRCEYLLENDISVKSFRRCDIFRGEVSWRNPDLLVEYIDGRIEIIEVKPEDMLTDETVQKQIEESKIFADKSGFGYRTWSEIDSGFTNEKEIINWAKEYLKINYNDVKFEEHQKSNRKRISKKHYDKKIKPDTIEHDCLYCNVVHTVLKKTYEAAIEKKGKWICEAEAGHIGGSKPKTSLIKENPYAAEGKKQCIGKECGQILKFEFFGVDKGRRDGYASKCKECRRKEANEKYSNREK